jgi:diamine N-acetyltransferase
MITIRPATQDDLSDLQILNDEIFIDNRKYDIDLDLNWAKGSSGESYFRELLNNKEAFCIIAEDVGKKIGYLAAGPKDIDYRKSKYCEVENMGVLPDYKSQGIGKALMEKSFEWAKSKGYQKMFVNAYIQNVPAISFYKKNGFSEIDISLEKIL